MKRLPLALLVALAAAIWVAAWLGIQWRGAESELGRQAEAQQLTLARVQLAHAVEVRELRTSAELVQRRLGEALKRAGVHYTPIVTVTGSTGPVQSGGERAAEAPRAAPAPAPADSPSPAGAGPACLLYEGEDGEIRVSAAAARTDAGNVAIDAQADAFALNPERHLFGGPLTLSAKYLKPRDEARAPGLGIGATVVGGRDGWSVGPAIAAPPLRVLGLQFEPSAAFTLGSGGAWAATGTVLVRRAR